MRCEVVVTVERAFLGDADRGRHFFRSRQPEAEGRAAVRAGMVERCPQIRRAVVDADLEAESGLDPTARRLKFRPELG